MVPQSRASAVLLTRPAAQSLRFATALRDRFGPLRIVTAPLMIPELLSPVLPQRTWNAVLFTSETGVQSAQRLLAEGQTLPRLAFCVGNQTARAATACGFTAVSAQGDGQALAQCVLDHRIEGPVLYLHGADRRVDIGQILNAAGVEAHTAISYAQRAEPLTAEAVMLVQSPEPLIAPIFSARSGQLLTREIARVGGIAPLYVAAISAEAAYGVRAAELQVAKRPDVAAMIEALVPWLG